MAGGVARNYFDVEPRIAMLSYSSFGSTIDANSTKVRRAVEIIHERWPELKVEGELQADMAVDPGMAGEAYPMAALQGDANILVCPSLDAANIAYKLLWRLGKVEAIGPILAGVNAPVYVLQRGVEVNDIVNMAAMCVLKAQRTRS
jgi:malate dehydrogenase (oxaloacetate-decarboxylating)(NADP+)